MSVVVLFSSLDRTPVSRTWVAESGCIRPSGDVRFVDCAGIPFFEQTIDLPDTVVRFANEVELATSVIIAIPSGPAGMGGVLETAVKWLCRPDLKHVTHRKPIHIQLGTDGAGPTEVPDFLMTLLSELTIDLTIEAHRPDSVNANTPPRRLNDWVGRIEAVQRCGSV